MNAGPPILFETHIDTVSARGMTIEPFAARIAGGRLWGRGATDAKAQAAAMLHALAAWARAGLAPPRTIELALVVDEEHGFGGARALAAEGGPYAGIVIGEPTGLRVVCTHKGTARLGVRLGGRAAHASHPEQGVNAISAAAALIEAIDRDYMPRLAARRAPLLGPPTAAVTMIEGGVQINLIPPECLLHLDRRTIPGETLEGVCDEIRALFAVARERFPAFEAELLPDPFYAPPVATPADDPFVRAACGVARACGGEPDPAGVDYATDACVLAPLGCPLIVAGPGSIAQAHTADEFIELAQPAQGARFFARLMAQPFE
jgi:acetylornithine deacetylase